MNRFRLSATIALILFGAVATEAQVTLQIQVLQPPSSIHVLPAQLAEGTLSVHYDGRLNRTRTIWVRVFRDSLNDLRSKYPRETEAGRCVVYAHAARFRVDHAFDRELRISDLVGFFQTASFHERQTLTLVFEEGDDPASNGPLRLEKGAVAGYFSNAIEMPLIAPDDMKVQWDREAQRLADAQKPEKSSIWARLSVGKKVYAGERQQPAPPPPTPIPANVVLPPCQKVKLISYTPLANIPMETNMLEALAPAGVRESRACGD
jgi:hypothetical protein